MPRDPAIRNVLILALCQGIGLMSNTVLITESALIGLALAPDRALATLPFGVQQIAVMCMAMPASMLMRRLGRRAGLTLGALTGAIGAIVAAYAVSTRDFWLFSSASALFGVASAFALYYRFAAADTASVDYRARAISWVMAGGVIAAVFGPELAKWSKDMIPPETFTGSFAALAGLNAIVMLLLRLVVVPPAQERADRATGRPLGAIVVQPAFLVAVIGGTVGFGGMSMLMSATPIAMHDHNHGFADAAFVIQWHVLGMFVPAFFTGHLIQRFGVLRVMVAGALLMGLGVAINLAGVDLAHFWLALVLVGVAWSFLYIGGSALLTEAYAPAETAKAQGLNELVVYGSVALSASISGAILDHLGWAGVNLAALPLVVLALASVLWLMHRRRIKDAS